jgi:hypothetical protein
MPFPRNVEHWPSDLPRLYPNLDERALCAFLTEPEYWRIRKLPMLAVLPLASDGGGEFDRAFGAGLSQLLIRDLMLVRDFSIRGPEDTPKISMETALLNFGRDDRKTSWVTGRAAARPNAFAAGSDRPDSSAG